MQFKKFVAGLRTIKRRDHSANMRGLKCSIGSFGSIRKDVSQFTKALAAL